MNRKRMTNKKTVGIVLALAALVLLPASVVFTQTKGPGTGLARISKPNQVQEGVKTEPAVKGAAGKMSDKAPNPLLVKGKVVKMEDHLKQPAAGGPQLMAKVDPAKAVQPALGK